MPTPEPPPLTREEEHELAALRRWIDHPPQTTPLDQLQRRQAPYLFRTQFNENVLRAGLHYAILRHRSAVIKFLRYANIAEEHFEDDIDVEPYVVRYREIDEGFQEQVGFLNFLSTAGTYEEMAMEAEIIDTGEWRRTISVAAHVIVQLERLSDLLARQIMLAQRSR